MKISKKLLSDVLSVSIGMPPIYDKRNNIEYLQTNDQSTLHQIKQQHHSINIYELAHKCKQWALKRGYTLHSGISRHGTVVYCNIVIRGNAGKLNKDKQIDWKITSMDNWSSTSDSEPAGIFSMCEWILFQPKKGN